MLNLLGMLTAGSVTPAKKRSRKPRAHAPQYRLYLEGQEVTTGQLAERMGISRQATHRWLTEHEHIHVKRVRNTTTHDVRRPRSVWTWI